MAHRHCDAESRRLNFASLSLFAQEKRRIYFHARYRYESSVNPRCKDTFWGFALVYLRKFGSLVPRAKESKKGIADVRTQRGRRSASTKKGADITLYGLGSYFPEASSPRDSFDRRQKG